MSCNNSLCSKSCVESLSSGCCPDCELPFNREEVAYCESIIHCIQMAKGLSEKDVNEIKTRSTTEITDSNQKECVATSGADKLNVTTKSNDVGAEDDDDAGVEDVRPASASTPRIEHSPSSSSLRSHSAGSRNIIANHATINGPIPISQPHASGAPICQFCKDSLVVAVCQDCNDIANLCQDCFAFRHRKGEMALHKYVSWSPSCVSTLCEHHKQDCLVFCRPCNIPVCTMCTLGDHAGHVVVVMADEVSACKQRLQAAVSNLERVSKDIQISALSIAAKYKEITGAQSSGDVVASMSTSENFAMDAGIYSPVIQSIRHHFDSLKDILEARKLELIDTVHTIRKEKAAVLAKQLNESSLYVSRNYALCFRLKQKIKVESNAFLCAAESNLLQEIGQQIDKLESVPKVPAVTSDIQFLIDIPDTMTLSKALPPSITSGSDGGDDDTILSASSGARKASIATFPGVNVPAVLRSIGKVVSNDVDPANCIIVGEALLRALTVNREVVLSLQVKDKQGGRVGIGGDNVTCVALANHRTIDGAVRVCDNGDGTYSLTCKFSEKGDMTLRVYLRGIEVGGSPLYFTVSNTLRTGTIGSAGSGEGQLLNPQGLCCHEGMLYVSDQANKRVQVFGCDGSYVWSIGSWGRGRRQLQSVNGVCYYDGMLFVSDSHNHRIHVFDHGGAYVRYVGGRGIGSGQLQNPQGICCSEGLLYVSDSANDRVQVFRCDGTFIRTIGQNLLQHPTGICCDRGLLYVCDTDNDRVQVFDCSDTKILRSIGGWGSGPGQMIGPTDVCCAQGLLCVSDRGNNRVEIFDEYGGYLRCVKEWKSGSNGQIQLPKGLCYYDGLLYVSDIDDHRVYIFSDI